MIGRAGTEGCCRRTATVVNPAVADRSRPQNGLRSFRMDELVDQDLHRARLERVDFSGATCSEVRWSGARMTRIDFSDVEMRGVLLSGTRIIGAEMSDVEITGELDGVTINGVDIGPLVEAELDRREPERTKMRPDDVAGYQEAWSIVRRRWDETMATARALPEALLHESVRGEWSFVQTLRHLNFASAAWIGRMVRGDPSPWHPLDLPWDEAPGWDGIPWDRDARPSLDEVTAVREQRQAMVGDVMGALTAEQLASTVSMTETGWPQAEAFPFRDCLRIVLNEEWAHRNFAERDLAALM